MYFRSVFLRSIARLAIVPDGIRNMFLSIWMEHKHLPLGVGHRLTLAKGWGSANPGPAS
jgi:hypothetical protein